MKYIFLKLIRLYQALPGNFHNHCRFIPTCSNYAYEAIDKYGLIKGTPLALKRISRCHPLGKFGYDPVPKELRRKKK